MQFLPPADNHALFQALLEELRAYPGIPLQRMPKWVVRLIIGLPIGRFASLAAQFDAIVEESGFNMASRWALSEFFDRIEIVGSEQIPLTGPLLIASNHPGTFDALAVAASLPRTDLKMIARGMDFLRQLPCTKESLIFSMRNVHAKMAAARSAIRHLKKGGALLVYPTGTVDPDPASMPGLRQTLANWSDSLELLVRNAQDTQIQIAFLSGFLSPKWFNHPIARLQKDARQRQIAAEIIQVLVQMLTRRKSGLTPRVVYGKPLHLDQLQAQPQNKITENIRAIAHALLDDQIASGVFQP